MIENTNSEQAWSPADNSSNGQKPRHAANTKPPRKLSVQRQAFVKELVSNPKANPTSAVRKTYNVTTDDSARNIASQLMANQDIQLELAKYTGYAKNALVQIITEGQQRIPQASDRDVAPLMAVVEKTANSVIDRVEGKSMQRVQVQSQAVTINIDLTQVS